MLQTYKKYGVQFEYERGWEVQEQGLSEAELGTCDPTITVQAPTGAFWSVSLFSYRADAEQLASAALLALQQEYEGLEHEKIEQRVAGYEVTGFDVHFWYLDLTVTAQIRSVLTEDALFVIFWQAEDGDAEEFAPLLQQMTLSLLENASAEAD